MRCRLTRRCLWEYILPFLDGQHGLYFVDVMNCSEDGHRHELWGDAETTCIIVGVSLS